LCKFTVSPMHVTCPANLVLLDFITLICSGTTIMKLRTVAILYKNKFYFMNCIKTEFYLYFSDILVHALDERQTPSNFQLCHFPFQASRRCSPVSTLNKSFNDAEYESIQDARQALISSFPSRLFSRCQCLF
jgi:hypothetical protein